jgi:nitrate/TMAO reductase-like tetraheme cytochrome c subunit
MARVKVYLDKRPVLYVMHLQDMHNVHPQQDNSQFCDRCHERVGIYPSGQKAIKEYGRENVEVVCSRCEMPDMSTPAPGALEEVAESIPNPAKNS